jgi:membrane protease YdiL (CAAX protease family)
VLVCAIAFGSGIIGSTRSLIIGENPGANRGGEWRWAYSMWHQVLALAVLWYVLQRRSRRFSDIGLKWSVKEVIFGILLFLAGMVFHMIVRPVLQHTIGDNHSTMFGQREVGRMLYGPHVGAIAFLSNFLNPFFEELIVRAWFMTVVRKLTNNLALAVIGSVLLQISYHFYQGVPGALAHVAEFTVFALYYAKTKRIGAPIIAHMLFDIIPTLFYMAKVHG